MAETAAAPETPAAAPDSTAPGAEGAPASLPGAEGAPAEPPKGGKPDRLAQRLVSLSRSEREARAAAKAAEDRAKAAEERVAKVDALKEVARRDPDGFLKEFGLTYQDITNAILASGEAPTPEAIAAELAEVKTKLTERDQREAEAAEKARAAEDARDQAARVEGIGKVIAEARTEDGAPKYEILARLGDEAAATALEAVAVGWREDGEPEIGEAEYQTYLTAALDALEAHYESEGKRYSKQTTRTEELKDTEPYRPRVTAGPPRTITNSHAGAPGPRPPQRHRSPREIAAEWAAATA
jgi:hypothetical protein